MNKDQVIAAVRKFSQSPFQVCLTDLKRPNEPEGNLICNAPRPIIGERLDYSEYLRGRFWTSIDPSSEMADWKVQDVIDMKGVFVVFVTAQEIEAWAAKYAEKNDLDIEEFDYATKRQSFFHNHEESIIP